MRTLDEIMAMKDLTKLTPIEICIRYSNVKGKALMKDEAQKAVAEYAALVGRVKIGHEEKVSTFIKIIEDWIESNPVSVYRNGDYDVFPEQVKQLAEALAAALDKGKGTA